MTHARPRLISSFLLLLFCATGLSAQGEDVDITGTLRFSSTASTTVYILSYGVGSNYTDTTDPGFEEFVPPFSPPGGYLIAFDRECSVTDGDPPCYFKQDFRGVPDSVASGENPQFALSYRIRVRNATRVGFQLAILNGDWPRGLDSLHVVDAQLASAFEKTFTGPEVAEVTDPETLWLNVTAYYNLQTLSVAEGVGAGSILASVVNPVMGQPLVLSSEDLPAPGGRLLLVDVNGRVLVDREVEGEVVVETDHLPNGAYHLLYFDRSGMLGEKRSILVIR